MFYYQIYHIFKNVFYYTNFFQVIKSFHVYDMNSVQNSKFNYLKMFIKTLQVLHLIWIIIKSNY